MSRLCANSGWAEVIEKDGSICIMGEDTNSKEVPAHPVEVYDIAILVLGLSLKQGHIKQLRAISPTAFPRDRDLADLFILEEA